MGYVISFFNLLFGVCYFFLVLRAVLPWIPHNRMNPLIRPVYDLTDPVLNPIRVALPPQKIGFDVSPFVGIILFWLLQGFVVNYLLGG